jgi:hypothetical protein
MKAIPSINSEILVRYCGKSLCCQHSEKDGVPLRTYHCTKRSKYSDILPTYSFLSFARLSIVSLLASKTTQAIRETNPILMLGPYAHAAWPRILFASSSSESLRNSFQSPIIYRRGETFTKNIVYAIAMSLRAAPPPGIRIID